MRPQFAGDRGLTPHGRCRCRTTEPANAVPRNAGRLLKSVVSSRPPPAPTAAAASLLTAPRKIRGALADRANGEER